MDKDSATLALQTGAAQIQAALKWFHDNEPSGTWDRIHGLLDRAAVLAEQETGAKPGSIANPDGGGPKDPGP